MRVEDLAEPMVVAGRQALSNPVLASAALTCAEAALAALPRHGADHATYTLVSEFVERYTARGRCPADDRLDGWRRTGLLSPFANQEKT